ncbi:hypothetical protein [Pseudactinotalea suaedae]|jgi:hypothetical protein|uniref:hypothetical protein n=1 Tax=Pseudactinotalea suaedae TaxID=1524924 RepID=UPI0012E0E74F|nr:hypothetical protein [Pseudactinotalea suaedae]
MNDILSTVVPPIGVLILFVIVIRAFVVADRRERAARQKIDAEIERRRAESRTAQSPTENHE